MLNCEEESQICTKVYSQSSIVEPACAESLSIASGKFCETQSLNENTWHRQKDRNNGMKVIIRKTLIL